MRVRIDKILPNPVQPRRVFEADEMRALAESIREIGLIHPVVVVKSGDWFVLVDGERRHDRTRGSVCVESPGTGAGMGRNCQADKTGTAANMSLVERSNEGA